MSRGPRFVMIHRPAGDLCGLRLSVNGDTRIGVDAAASACASARWRAARACGDTGTLPAIAGGIAAVGAFDAAPETASAAAARPTGTANVTHSKAITIAPAALRVACRRGFTASLPCRRQEQSPPPECGRQMNSSLQEPVLRGA